jgi:F-type H+-transporting ATPase subunit alpha
VIEKIKNDKPEIIEVIQSTGKLDEDTENELKQVIEEYKKNNA